MKMTWKVLVLAASFATSTALLQGSVGYPNILLRNKADGSNKVWFMSPGSYQSETPILGTSGDHSWKIVGTGDFTGDGQVDILWQHPSDVTAVWEMNGTSYIRAHLLQSAGDPNWKIVGVADFNGDNKPDILWQNLVSVQNAVWLMNGLVASSYHLIVSNGDPNWRLAATGHFGNGGAPDIILRNESTGQNAIWYFGGANGLELIAGDFLYVPGNPPTPLVELDIDWKIVGTGHRNGDLQTDITLRHATLGLDVFWNMNGNIYVSSTYFKSEYNVDWRIATQDMADSYWRLESEKARSTDTYLTANVTASPPRVTLNYKLLNNLGAPIAIHRRRANETTWSPAVVTQDDSSYVDTTVQAGERYEYKIYRQYPFGGTNQSGLSEHLTVAIGATPIENRGRIILLIDSEVEASLTTHVNQLKQDLVADGWTVVSETAPRHDANAWLPNGQGTVVAIKQNKVIPRYLQDPANTKAILIIGHVAVPYSGAEASDGHDCDDQPGRRPDHRGAWAADLYYADVDSTWSDNSVNLDNCDYSLNDNTPNDGKFDPSYFVSNLAKLAVGRIDFARLPVFGTSDIKTEAEITLLKAYLDKVHKYRCRGKVNSTNGPSPFPTWMRVTMLLTKTLRISSTTQCKTVPPFLVRKQAS